MAFIINNKIVSLALLTTFVFLAYFVYRAGRTVTVIGINDGSFWSESAAFFPEIPEKEENRIDILLLGMRGQTKDEKEDFNGDFLADTIILASFDKETQKASIVSIPRDLYIEIPQHGKEKINAAYAVGEARGEGGGLQLSKLLVSSITGVYVDYAVRIDFEGFKKIIDDLGGIVIYRNSPFEEAKQWVQDGKKDKTYWELREGGWAFYVPKGANIMNSEEALYYARSRYSSSDFDRMNRQQEVVEAIKSKALNLGIVANPIKILNILDTLENNMRTDMSILDIKNLIGFARDSKVQNFQKAVIQSGEGELLYEDRVNGQFVLLPYEETYIKIRALVRGILN